jgi:hypothetical protein
MDGAVSGYVAVNSSIAERRPIEGEELAANDS